MSASPSGGRASARRVTLADQSRTGFGRPMAELPMQAGDTVARLAGRACETFGWGAASRCRLYRVPDEKRLEWARPIAAKIENDVPKNKEEVYAREALILHERQKTSVKLQAIRIGNPGMGELGITTLPNEVYALTGLLLKWTSPFQNHFNIELANGAEGYIPPREQHALGGYTTWPARTAGLEVGAEEKIRTALRDMVGELDLAPGRGMSEDCPPYTSAIIDSHVDLFIDFQSGMRDLCAVHTGAKTVVKGGHALWLPGFNAGRGYGDESALKPQQVQVPRDKINRSIHLAGGHLETSNLKLGTLSIKGARQNNLKNVDLDIPPAYQQASAVNAPLPPEDLSNWWRQIGRAHV